MPIGRPGSNRLRRRCNQSCSGSVMWLLRTFDDLGERKQNCHDRGRLANSKILVGGAAALTSLREKSMFRQIFLVPICALLLALGIPADAQQPKKISRVAYLAAVSAAADAPR